MILLKKFLWCLSFLTRPFTVVFMLLMILFLWIGVVLRYGLKDGVRRFFMFMDRFEFALGFKTDVDNK